MRNLQTSADWFAEAQRCDATARGPWIPGDPGQRLFEIDRDLALEEAAKLEREGQ